VSGTGSTGTLNGLGNLIVGYNEESGQTRTGSHNLVVGPLHTYTSYGGLVAGHENTVGGPYSSVSGGWRNSAEAEASSVTGGQENTASEEYSSVSGGYSNEAGGDYSSVSGGANRSVSGQDDWRAGDLFQDQ
jgi:hypothetical protein